ncbi:MULTISPECIES: hypothetical protein [unclassified Phyllobacterium]|uniref:hypothetical protein n=1 Tax=unclassified Phyllobacterium TaxID=2638441 RepID=UPI003012C209
MNEFSAYTQPVPGGWRVMLRFSKDGHPKPVMDVGNKPLVLPCKLEATETAIKHLLAYMNGDYQRCGVTLSTAISEAEALFKPILRKAGRKPVQVERVGARP